MELERTDGTNTLAKVIIILLAIGAFLLIYLAINDSIKDSKKDYRMSCTTECSSLGLTFYKVDVTRSYGGYYDRLCYCLDKDNVPRNIGVTNG